MNDLFDGDQTAGEKDPIEVLTGPGGKYDRAKYETEADMWKAVAKGKVEADTYINFKNKEFDTLRDDLMKTREELSTGRKLEDWFDQLSRKQQLDDNTLKTPDVKEKPQQLDEAQLENIVLSKIQEAESKKQQAENFKKVESKLREHYGNNYAAVLKQKTDEFGLDPTWVNDTARKYPEVLFRALGLEQQTRDSFQAPPASSQRSGFTPSVNNNRNFAYYEKLRKDDPSNYWSGKTQLQMLEDMKTNPNFKDSSWDKEITFGR